MSMLKLTASAVAIAAVSATAAAARDQVQIAGSSTVLPYSTIVAEAFGENFDFATPVVESGGTGTGFRRFCEGVGENTVDIANASRPIRDNEMAECTANGVSEIIEIRIGYDGIVFASDINGPSFAFTPEDWFKAMAAQVVVDGEVVANPYTTWNEVNPELPEQRILAFIPGTRHGTREVFEERVMHAGCRSSGAEEVLQAAGVEGGCMAVRTDGVAVDIDGDYTETLARVDSNREAIGVFGLAFYENNTNRLQVATMSGVEPSVETISTGEYPVSRPLFIYLKKAHIGVIPGLKEFAQFFVSDEMAGPNGPLAQYGLVSDPELAETQALVEAEETM